MKKPNFYLIMFTMLLSSVSFAQNVAESGDQYKLKRVIEVEGRQGIAVDADYYYVTGSKSIYKYDKEGKLLEKNLDPFKGFTKKVNHLGDIDVYNNEIFTGVEFFVDGAGKDIQLAVYDASTLKLKYTMDFDPTSGQTECSGIAIDRERNTAWLSDWVNGNYLYRYDLTTKKYAGKVHLQPVPQYQQGVFYSNGKMLITADDGEADDLDQDNIYIADVSDHGKVSTEVKLFKKCVEFKRAGEIEGLSIDPTNDDLLVLTNRGSRIILGMVKGWYPGYNKEIHSLYIYEKTTK